MSRGLLKLGVTVAGATLLLSGCQSVDQAAIDAQPLACPPDSECYDEVRPVGPGSTLEVESGEFYFEILDGVAIDGPVTVVLVNEGDALHNFRIDAAAGDEKKVETGPNSTAEGVLELFGGTSYTYYCDIPGHRSQGMEGELTVYLDEETARAEGAFDDGGTEDDATEPADGGTEPADETEAEPTGDATEA